MKMLRTAALALPLTLVSASLSWAQDSEETEASYAIGILMGTGMLNQLSSLAEMGVDNDQVLAGITAAFGAAESTMTAEEAEAKVQAFMLKAQEAEAAAAAEAAAGKLADNAAFLEENGAKEGVITTESGLQYKVVAEGEGESPTPSDQVTVHYEGRLLDGTVFDSSIARGQPATFPVGGVIPGWIEALQLMKPGAKFELWIPSKLGYGPQGAGGAIGPNEVLNFDVELIEIAGQ